MVIRWKTAIVRQKTYTKFFIFNLKKKLFFSNQLYKQLIDEDKDKFEADLGKFIRFIERKKNPTFIFSSCKKVTYLSV